MAVAVETDDNQNVVENVSTQEDLSQTQAQQPLHEYISSLNAKQKKMFQDFEADMKRRLQEHPDKPLRQKIAKGSDPNPVAAMARAAALAQKELGSSSHRSSSKSRRRSSNGSHAKEGPFNGHDPQVVLRPVEDAQRKVEDVPVMIVMTRKALSMGMIRFDLLQQVVHPLRVEKEHRKEFFLNHQRPSTRRLDPTPVLNQYF